MAQPITATRSKDHRSRKNPGSAEFFKKQRKEQNAKRPKQRWVEPAIDTSNDVSPAEGYWTRETA